MSADNKTHRFPAVYLPQMAELERVDPLVEFRGTPVEILACSLTQVCLLFPPGYAWVPPEECLSLVDAPEQPFDVLRSSVYEQIHRTYPWHSWTDGPLSESFRSGLARSIGLSIDEKADILEAYPQMRAWERASLEAVFAEEGRCYDALGRGSAEMQEVNRRVVRNMRAWADFSLRFSRRR